MCAIPSYTHETIMIGAQEASDCPYRFESQRFLPLISSRHHNVTAILILWDYPEKLLYYIYEKSNGWCS